MEAIIITIFNNYAFAVHSVQPEILLSTEGSSLPVHITGLKWY